MKDKLATLCLSEEAALKGLFLGPQAENSQWVSAQINALLNSWFEWRRSFRPGDGRAVSSADMESADYIKRRQHTDDVLQELASRFEQEIPKFSPRYIGHMFSETSLPALFGHILTLLHNPNNISGESSWVGVTVEEEAITALAQMMGFRKGIGHFTSGGTIANFEAVYRARTRCVNWMAAGLEQGCCSAFASAAMGYRSYNEISHGVKASAERLNPFEGNPFIAAQEISQKIGRDFLGPVLLIPEHKHYSWTKSAHVFGLGAEALWPVQLDAHGHLDIQDLKRQIRRAQLEDRPIVMVVSVLGTTELGMIDPIHEVQELLDMYRHVEGWHIWHHVDAAYGGFLCSLKGENQEVSGVLSEQSLKAIEAMGRATSVTIDPHKLGYVPYSSGAFITADEKDYYQRSFGAPYVNFSVNKDKGPFTLEGSRSAAGAVATWMTAQCVGFSQEGYGRLIARTIRLRKEMEEVLRENVPNIRVAPSGDANLLGFCVAQPGDSLQKVNERTLRLYETFAADNHSDFFISKTRIYKKCYSRYFENVVSSWQGRIDADELVLARICIMNPFFKTKEMNVDFQDLFVQSLQERVRGLDSLKI
ncbi:pyridoxal-dependent decarboxylase [Bdellovibrio bacteriovorus]|uniref:pyridoxal phosphate-dependent decarboxylase family protein n=1 Tax=Bdellovibrio bacteriovorus TaxID=959 RepID=UPI0021D3B6AA|nr:pyridoxal-dependent decarboxylase [Bdellovibrio bacteriovorus]UXR65297.1 pyridoxal-dependent decarboxylase [Bdellovibrio bacteriovorus]